MDSLHKDRDNAPPASDPSNEEANEGTNEFINALSNSTEAIGSSLQTMQKALVGNIQQVAQLTLSMNMMMEELVKKAVRIGVFAAKPTRNPENSSYSTALCISVTNNSPIPLVNMAAKLRFALRFDAADGEQEIKLSSAPSRKSEPSEPSEQKKELLFSEQSTRLNRRNIEDENAFMEQQSKPMNLGSGGSAEATLTLSADTLLQLDGQILVEFLSPGTGSLLAVNHRFGIHIMHLLGNQCWFCSAKDVADKLKGQAEAFLPAESTSSFDIDLSYMRRAFSVPPANGIEKGSIFVFSISSSFIFGLRVLDIVNDSSIATCEWITMAAENTRPLPEKQAFLLSLLSDEISSHIL
ncbi:hypothetical protein BX070DRAFT_255614 [Coemansia spiralis]|nr:hypothetical protein BX070DRAFT_255614 [Coemansia spiralis]